MASALFRFIAAACRNMIVANTFGTFALLLLFAMSGFVLSRGIRKKQFFGNVELSCSDNGFCFLFVFDQCCRTSQEMVDLVLLVFPYDVCTKCNNGK